MDLIIATGNKKKLEEIKHMLCDLHLNIASLAEYSGLPKIIEDGDTFKQNAIKKAVTIANHLNVLVLGEDSGLEVKALGGKPGVYSARYAGENACDKDNNAKLLNDLKDIAPANRQAKYVCCVALADAHGVLGTVEGTCEGVIAQESKGDGGFGYDPLFLIPEYGQTFGQLGGEIKHSMSHRFHAFQKARELIINYQKSSRQAP